MVDHHFISIMESKIFTTNYSKAVKRCIPCPHIASLHFHSIAVRLWPQQQQQNFLLITKKEEIVKSTVFECDKNLISIQINSPIRLKTHDIYLQLIVRFDRFLSQANCPHMQPQSLQPHFSTSSFFINKRKRKCLREGALGRTVIFTKKYT